MDFVVIGLVTKIVCFILMWRFARQLVKRKEISEEVYWLMMIFIAIIYKK